MGFNSLGMITIQKIITLLLPYYLFTLIICMLCHKLINGTPRAVVHHLSKDYRIPRGTQFRITNKLQIGMVQAKPGQLAAQANVELWFGCRMFVV